MPALPSADRRSSLNLVRTECPCNFRKVRSAACQRPRGLSWDGGELAWWRLRQGRSAEGADEKLVLRILIEVPVLASPQLTNDIDARPQNRLSDLVIFPWAEVGF